MADIYEFKRADEQEQQEHPCEVCELADEYVEYIKHAIGDPDKLVETVKELINEAKNVGYMNAMVDDINMKKSFIELIVSSTDED